MIVGLLAVRLGAFFLLRPEVVKAKDMRKAAGTRPPRSMNERTCPPQDEGKVVMAAGSSSPSAAHDVSPQPARPASPAEKGEPGTQPLSGEDRANSSSDDVKSPRV